jgi:hypothetical protein
MANNISSSLVEHAAQERKKYHQQGNPQQHQHQQQYYIPPQQQHQNHRQLPRGGSGGRGGGGGAATLSLEAVARRSTPPVVLQGPMRGATVQLAPSATGLERKARGPSTHPHSSHYHQQGHYHEQQQVQEKKQQQGLSRMVPRAMSPDSTAVSAAGLVALSQTSGTGIEEQRPAPITPGIGGGTIGYNNKDGPNSITSAKNISGVSKQWVGKNKYNALNNSVPLSRSFKYTVPVQQSALLVPTTDL